MVADAGASGNPGGCWALGTGDVWEEHAAHQENPMALGFILLGILLSYQARDGRG